MIIRFKGINKKHLKKWKKIISLIMIIIALIITYKGIDTHWTGTHNIDICHNEKILSLQLDLEIKELTLAGTTWDLTTCYLTGLKQIRKGLIMFGLGLFILGFAINYLLKPLSKN